MNHDFDEYAREQLLEILCENDREHSLSRLRKSDLYHRNTRAKLPDWAVPLSFSLSQA